VGLVKFIQRMKTFSEFLYESENEDTRLVSFFSSLTRNYESKAPFYTDQLQFSLEQEKKEWENVVNLVQLHKTVEVSGTYTAKFHMEEKNYSLKISLKFYINGQNEKDAPDKLADEDMDRLNIVLEKVETESIEVKSTDFDSDISGKNISQPVEKACEAFLVKMLASDYDSLGEELYRI
jgi:hypothetical protein